MGRLPGFIYFYLARTSEIVFLSLFFVLFACSVSVPLDRVVGVAHPSSFDAPFQSVSFFFFSSSFRLSFGFNSICRFHLLFIRSWVESSVGLCYCRRHRNLCVFDCGKGEMRNYEFLFFSKQTSRNSISWRRMTARWWRRRRKINWSIDRSSPNAPAQTRAFLASVAFSGDKQTRNHIHHFQLTENNNKWNDRAQSATESKERQHHRIDDNATEENRKRIDRFQLRNIIDFYPAIVKWFLVADKMWTERNNKFNKFFLFRWYLERQRFQKIARIDIPFVCAQCDE